MKPPAVAKAVYIILWSEDSSGSVTLLRVNIAGPTGAESNPTSPWIKSLPAEVVSALVWILLVPALSFTHPPLSEVPSNVAFCAIVMPLYLVL